MVTTRKPSSRRSERPIGKGWTDEILRGALIPVADLGEELRPRAALCAAGLALRHPCTARRHPRRACAHPRHAEDRERLRVALDCLGLLPEPAPEPEQPEQPQQPETGGARLTLTADWSWTDQAACRGAAPGLFFGPDGEKSHAKQIREAKAKAICAGCPVRHPCLHRALIAGELGVWGGTAEEERTRGMRRRAIERRAQQLEKEELAS